MTDEQFEDFLKAALTGVMQVPPATTRLPFERVLKSAWRSRCLARSSPLWRLPSVLLNWDFAPAWPRMAAPRLLRGTRLCRRHRRARSSVRPT